MVSMEFQGEFYVILYIKIHLFGYAIYNVVIDIIDNFVSFGTRVVFWICGVRVHNQKIATTFAH